MSKMADFAAELEDLRSENAALHSRLQAVERIADDLVSAAHVNGHKQLEMAKKSGDEGDSEGANWHQGYWVACEEILQRAEDEHGMNRHEALTRMKKRWDEERDATPTPEVSDV